MAIPASAAANVGIAKQHSEADVSVGVFIAIRRSGQKPREHDERPNHNARLYHLAAATAILVVSSGFRHLLKANICLTTRWLFDAETQPYEIVWLRGGENLMTLPLYSALVTKL